MKKKIYLTILSLLTVALLASCACNTTPTPSPSPTPTATIAATPLPSPSVEASPSTSPSTSPESSPAASPEGSASPEGGAAVDTAKIKTEVEKLSEVKTATVAAMDGTALVGVTFDDAYQGTLTARITEMVTEKVKAVETGITTVDVTADPALCEEIQTLQEQMKDSTGSADAKTAFDDLKKKIQPAS